MRYIEQGTAQDGTGRVIQSANITVYLDDGATLATIYSVSSGGTAVTNSLVQSDTYGWFEFWVDDSEYTPSQKFDIVLSKTGYTGQTWENVKIIPDEPYFYYADATATNQGAATTRSDRSLKDLIDAIGTSDQATIKVVHSGTGNTTTYILGTSLDLSSYSNIYLDFEPGALIQPAAGVTLTVYSPAHIIAGPAQQIIDSTNNSTDPLQFSKAGTFPVNWWGVADEAAQTAITEFGRLPGCHMKFVGEHAWNGPVKLTYANDSQVMSKVSGWGSKITSTVNGSYCLEFETGSYTAKLLVVEGFHFQCGGDESGVLLFDADSDCTKFFFNVTIKNILANNFGGNGIEYEGCFFESRMYDCDLVTSAANITGYCIYFNGVTQYQSSMSVYECTTRGGKHGIFATGTRETYINGGTYILSDHEGIYLNSGRNTVINAHCEDNCVDSLASGTPEAGMTMAGSGTIIGFRAQADEYDQLYGLYLVPSAQSETTSGAIHVVGGEWDPVVAGGNNTVAFIKCEGAVGSALILDGNQTVYQANANASITRNFSYNNYTDVSTSGTDATTLMNPDTDYVVPRYLFPLHSSMKITANGTITEANGGTKLIELCIGDDAIEVHPAHNSGTSNWMLEVTLTVHNATAISVFWKFYDSDAAATAVITQGATAITQDISAEFQIYLRGTCSNAGDDITKTNIVIDYK